MAARGRWGGNRQVSVSAHIGRMKAYQEREVNYDDNEAARLAKKFQCVSPTELRSLVDGVIVGQEDDEMEALEVSDLTDYENGA
ncbi:hypothetical protein YB2330_006427 [Saitoella coloradoensis]